MLEIQQRAAVKALIVNERNEVLLLRKSLDEVRHAGKSGRYNLPGGKVLPGEDVYSALAREVREETGLLLEGRKQLPFFVGDWRPLVRGVLYQIVGTFFICKDWHGTLRLDSEHDAYVWLTPAQCKHYDILPPEDEAIRVYFDQWA